MRKNYSWIALIISPLCVFTVSCERSQPQIGLSRAPDQFAVDVEDVSLRRIHAVNVLGSSFVSGTFLDAVRELHGRGSEGALAELRRYEATCQNVRGYDRSRTILLARYLFRPREAKDWRTPMLGAPDFPVVPGPGSEREMSEVFPLLEGHGVVVMLVDAFLVSGVPESPESYLSYCSTKCNLVQRVPERHEADPATFLAGLRHRPWWAKVDLTGDRYLMIKQQLEK